jgi:predicted RNase H-like HicB family nuclease
MKYAVVYERAPNNYAAYVPDLPGCVAAAKTLDETRRLMRGAIQMHIEAIREAGDQVPPPTSSVEMVEV